MADDIGSIIRNAAAARGVDPSVLLRIANAESSFKPDAGDPRSSASGLFGFTVGTARDYGLNDPRDPVASSDAAARLTSDNMARLSSAGLPVNAASLYALHFAGPAGGVRLLKADPGSPVASILGPAAIAANPFLDGMSVSDFRSWAARKMGNAPDAASSRPPADVSSSPPNARAMTQPDSPMRVADAGGTSMPQAAQANPGASLSLSPPGLAGNAAQDPDFQKLSAMASNLVQQGQQPLPPMRLVPAMPAAMRARLMALARNGGAPANPQLA